MDHLFVRLILLSVICCNIHLTFGCICISRVKQIRSHDSKDICKVILHSIFKLFQMNEKKRRKICFKAGEEKKKTVEWRNTSKGQLAEIETVPAGFHTALFGLLFPLPSLLFLCVVVAT